jgi:PAS domain S-box-containing protein
MTSNDAKTEKLQLQLNELQLKYDILKSAADREICDLRQSIESLRTMINATDESVYLFSADGILLVMNDIAVKSLDGVSGQWVGKSIFEVLPADVAASMRPFIERVISAGEPVDYTEMKNGRWIMSHIYPVPDEQGKVARLVIFSRDVTESIQAKELVQQTRHNYETFFNTVDDFLWVLDLQGNIIFTNGTVIERLEYSQEELSGKSILMVHPAERRSEAGRIVGEMLIGKTSHCPVPIVTKSGIQIPVETRVSYGSWDGNPVIYGVSKDISKIKLSEEKFSKVFYLNPSACGLSDLSDSKYIEVNDAFCALLGFEKDEVIGKTAPELNILSTESIHAILLNADENGNVTEVHAKLKTKNGETRDVLLSSENIHVQDKIYRFTVVHDITENIKAGKEIRALNQTLEQKVKERTEELETINKKLAFHLGEIEQLTYIAAHDLSEPLVTLTNFTQLIHEEYAGKLDEEGNKSIDFIYYSATRMKSLVKGILDYSRLGKESILSSVDCHKIACEVLIYLKDSITVSSAKINLNQLPVVNGFETEIILLFQNLINNAIKFRKKGIFPEINISAKLLDNEWHFTVEDNGIGINEHDREKVFVIFKRMVKRDEYEGTGIGLAHCKKIVELHGGRIWVESNYNGGSAFNFTIPA